LLNNSLLGIFASSSNTGLLNEGAKSFDRITMQRLAQWFTQDDLSITTVAALLIAVFGKNCLTWTQETVFQLIERKLNLLLVSSSPPVARDRVNAALTLEQSAQIWSEYHALEKLAIINSGRPLDLELMQDVTAAELNWFLEDVFTGFGKKKLDRELILYIAAECMEEGVVYPKFNLSVAAEDLQRRFPEEFDIVHTHFSTSTDPYALIFDKTNDEDFLTKQLEKVYKIDLYTKSKLSTRESDLLELKNIFEEGRII